MHRKRTTSVGLMPGAARSAASGDALQPAAGALRRRFSMENQARRRASSRGCGSFPGSAAGGHAEGWDGARLFMGPHPRSSPLRRNRRRNRKLPGRPPKLEFGGRPPSIRHSALPHNLGGEAWKLA